MISLAPCRINNLTNCVGILLSPCDSVANRLPIARRLGANLYRDNKPYGDNEIETIHGTLTATASGEFCYSRLRLVGNSLVCLAFREIARVLGFVLRCFAAM
jgi:hypothetical protein